MSSDLENIAYCSTNREPNEYKIGNEHAIFMLLQMETG